MNAEIRVAEILAIKETLVKIYAEDREAGRLPSETVNRFIESVGKSNARNCLDMIVRHISWDGRIGRAAKEWAYHIDPPESWTKRADYFSTDKIHPAHINQLAEAASKIF